MASADVFPSQDCLRHHHPHRQIRGNNASFFPKTHGGSVVPNSMRFRRRKRSPTGFSTNRRDEFRNNKVSDTMDPSVSAKNIVMGQVKILKRGEPLPDMNTKMVASEAKPNTNDDRHDEEMILCSTGRLGPDPDLVQKQIRASDFYAGSAPIVASPHPSSLPFPNLVAKKEKKSDAATMDLLRMLRLDLP